MTARALRDTARIGVFLFVEGYLVEFIGLLV
jgi:hypothetical protein